MKLAYPISEPFEKSCIKKIVEKEFAIYRYHLREQNNKPNWEWLRNMYYSIGQQFIRMNPAYYALYIAFRPDYTWRFVSYPYYAKYIITGDKTFFQYIDINLNTLMENNRGANII